MRIIAGTARGRRLAAPARTKGKPPIRPTADRAREALFSILGPAVAGARVLDLFAGTGALGLEALSRGAAYAVFVDRNREAVALIRENIRLCGFDDRALLIQRDLAKGLGFLAELAAPDFSLVFFDPPYGTGMAARLVVELKKGKGLATGAIVVAEDAPGEELPQASGTLRLFDRRRYGDTGFWLYHREEILR
ncbi:MAG: 16S rRNA (guanine(966)-N(2))-methyltransferase RsmD [Desulfobacteraceae bacterium]|nr:16S rRNA (guanine(966)-N(2))-methyltransferase RsmD [Desulfobacteraceae bacterium]